MQRRKHLRVLNLTTLKKHFVTSFKRINKLFSELERTQRIDCCWGKILMKLEYVSRFKPELNQQYNRWVNRWHQIIVFQLSLQTIAFVLGSPVPWSHPGPCRNTVLQSAAQTNAAASFSWCFVVSSASLPSELSPDPEENRAWKPGTTPQAPCSWTVLDGHTQRVKDVLQALQRDRERDR